MSGMQYLTSWTVRPNGQAWPHLRCNEYGAIFVQTMNSTGGSGGTGLTQTELLAAQRSTAAAKSAVASATTSGTILAANSNRKGATITNSDANTLYLDLSGGTAASTSYSVPVAGGGYAEVPFGWTGAITGVWAADGAGYALVTEFS